MEHNYFGNITKKSTSLIIAVASMVLCFILSANTDFAKFSDYQELRIPLWFFYIIFSVDILIVVSLVLLLLYRKLGIFGTVIFGFLHFVFNIYYLNVTLYADLFFLFTFCVGLFSIIPRWKYFK